MRPGSWHVAESWDLDRSAAGQHLQALRRGHQSLSRSGPVAEQGWWYMRNHGCVITAGCSDRAGSSELASGHPLRVSSGQMRLLWLSTRHHVFRDHGWKAGRSSCTCSLQDVAGRTHTEDDMCRPLVTKCLLTLKRYHDTDTSLAPTPRGSFRNVPPSPRGVPQELRSSPLPPRAPSPAVTATPDIDYQAVMQHYFGSVNRASSAGLTNRELQVSP